MPYTVFGLALFGLLFLWGAGLAALVLPRRWRSHWPVFAPLSGLAAVSAVVWIGAHLQLPGATAYATWTWPVPALLALLAFLRRAPARGGWKAAVRLVGNDLWRHGAVLAVALAVLVGVTRLMDAASRSLTSFSAGSCDSADYAAGARVFREFSISDRTGHLGNSEVVALHAIDNFPDHWLRQNHFTPAAVLAWWSAALGMPVHELVTLAGAVFLAATVPLAFWAGRALFHFAAGPSLLLAAAVGVSGTQVYAVAQTALAQLIATGAVVVLTWAGRRTWEEGRTWRGAGRWLPTLVLAMWLLLGAYNFMVVLAPLALAGWLTVRFLRDPDPARLGRTVAAGAAALALGSLFAPARVLGLRDRFALFGEHDFGWRIPGFTPERWFGWFGDADLAAATGAVPWLVGAVPLVLLASWSFENRRSIRARAALASIVPPLLGYGWLLWSAARHGSNESYNAYKLFSVFHPILLAGLCGWLVWTRQRHERAVTGWLLAWALLGVAWFGAEPVRAGIAQPRLRVERELLDLRRIEGMADVNSLNMVLEPFWDRLWANALLLRKPQYFRTYTYETRRPTALRGEWDLCDRTVAVQTGDAGERPVNGRFHLLRHGPRFVAATLGPGWFPAERLGPAQWMWTGGVAALRLTNPHPYPLTASLRGRLRSITPRQLALQVRGAEVWTGPAGVDEAPFATPGFALPPGETTVEFKPSGTPVTPPGDGRALSVAVYDLEVLIDGGPGGVLETSDTAP